MVEICCISLVLSNWLQLEPLVAVLVEELGGNEMLGVWIQVMGVSCQSFPRHSNISDSWNSHVSPDGGTTTDFTSSLERPTGVNTSSVA